MVVIALSEMGLSDAGRSDEKHVGGGLEEAAGADTSIDNNRSNVSVTDTFSAIAASSTDGSASA